MGKQKRPKRQNQTKSAQKRILFLEHYKLAGFNISKACSDTGIARCMIYKWREDPAFEQAMEDAGEELIDLVELELQKQIKNGNTMATMYFLNNKGKRRGWSQRQDVKVDHGDMKIEVIIKKYSEDKTDGS